MQPRTRPALAGRFGKLFVIRKLVKRGKWGHSLYLLRCDCGKRIVRPRHELLVEREEAGRALHAFILIMG